MAVRRSGALGEDKAARAVGADDFAIRFDAQVDQRMTECAASAVTSDDRTGNNVRFIVEGNRIDVGHCRNIDHIDGGMIAIERGQSMFTRSRHGWRAIKRLSAVRSA